MKELNGKENGTDKYNKENNNRKRSSTWSPIFRGITSPTTISYIEISTLLPLLITFSCKNPNKRLKIWKQNCYKNCNTTIKFN